MLIEKCTENQMKTHHILFLCRSKIYIDLYIKNLIIINPVNVEKLCTFHLYRSDCMAGETKNM